MIASEVTGKDGFSFTAHEALALCARKFWEREYSSACLALKSHAPSNIIRLFSIEYLEHRTKMPRRPKEASFRNDTSRPYPAKVVLIVIV